MRTTIFLIVIALMLQLSSCEETGEKGSLVVTGVSAVSEAAPLAISPMKIQTNSTVNVMHPSDIKFFVTEFWVAKELVDKGVTDDFKWYKIGESNALKSVSEYYFETDDLPEGTYQSIKLVFKNIVQREAIYQNNSSQLVVMQSSLDETTCPDDKIITNCFSKKGNFVVQQGVFQLASSGETIRGFKVKAGETTTIKWMLGAPGAQLTDCSFEWVDSNSNGQWDCGIDSNQNTQCKVNMPMFTFQVDDGEEEPVEEDFVLTPNAVTDLDGFTYYSVKIGDQIWLASNLRTRYLNDNTFIANRLDSMAWSDAGFRLQEPSQTVYNGNSELLQNYYGRLYNGYAIKTGKLCPQGWHVPTIDEWKKLFNHLGENAGGKMKEPGFDNWKSPNEGGNNLSRFWALPAGRRFINSQFTDLGESAWWWTSTVYGEGMLEVIKLGHSTNMPVHSIPDTRFDPAFGASCRCIKD